VRTSIDPSKNHVAPTDRVHEGHTTATNQDVRKIDEYRTSRGRNVVQNDGEISGNPALIVRSFHYIFKPPFPSDGGYAAASARRSGPPAPLPHGSLRDPLGLLKGGTWPDLAVADVCRASPLKL
jgi:hypothetical protein